MVRLVKILNGMRRLDLFHLTPSDEACLASSTNPLKLGEFATNHGSLIIIIHTFQVMERRNHIVHGAYVSSLQGELPINIEEQSCTEVRQLGMWFRTDIYTTYMFLISYKHSREDFTLHTIQTISLCVRRCVCMYLCMHAYEHYRFGVFVLEGLRITYNFLISYKHSQEDFTLHHYRYTYTFLYLYVYYRFGLLGQLTNPPSIHRRQFYTRDCK